MRLLQENQFKKDKEPKQIKVEKVKLNLTRGPSLRSRKITYYQKESSQSSEQEIFQHQIDSNAEEKIALEQNKNKSNVISKPKVLINRIIQKKDNQICQENYAISDQESEVNNPFVTPTKRRKRQSRVIPLNKIFFSDEFRAVKQIDFQIYFKMLHKAKMYSTLLINEFGQVIYADRLGSEHFEGSLNNLQRNPIQSMILQSKLNDFQKKASQVSKHKSSVTKLLIYSKNSKRRYSKISNKISLTNQDIFNRYLKCISCQMTPIEIKFAQFQKYEGFWNLSLIEKNIPLNCYLFKARLSREMPNLDELKLKEDKKIQKFIKYTQKKQAEKQFQTEGKRQSQNFNENNLNFRLIRNFERQNDQLALSKKDYQNIYDEMNDEVKHSKSSLTRLVLNSGGGKQKKQKF